MGMGGNDAHANVGGTRLVEGEAKRRAIGILGDDAAAGKEEESRGRGNQLAGVVKK